MNPRRRFVLIDQKIEIKGKKLYIYKRLTIHPMTSKEWNPVVPIGHIRKSIRKGKIFLLTIRRRDDSVVFFLGLKVCAFFQVFFPC